MAEEPKPSDSFTLLGVGDIHPTGSARPERLFEHCAALLKSGDITFAQLEVLFSDRGSLQLYPGAAAFIRNPPDFASCLPFAGIDVVSCASNHSLDWGYDALLDSMQNVRAQEVKAIGAGNDDGQAREPAVFQVGENSVAILAYTSVASPACYASDRRSGVAPMRADTYYQPIEYQAGTPVRIVTVPDKSDLANLVADVERAKTKYDVVIVSLHWGVHHLPKVIADYQPIVAHAAIDAGADLILGHHPHVLKAIEVYRGKTIFYSLGNFAMGKSGHDDAGREPRRWWYERHRNYYTFGKSSLPTPGAAAPLWTTDSVMTMVAKAVIRNHQIERVSFIPTMINKESQPEILSPDNQHFQEIVDYVNWTSEEFPRKLEVVNDEVVILAAD